MWREVFKHFGNEEETGALHILTYGMPALCLISNSPSKVWSNQDGKMTKYITQERHGRNPKKKGIRVQITSFEPMKTKSFTIHGYALMEIYDLLKSFMYVQDYYNNERIRKKKHRRS